MSNDYSAGTLTVGVKADTNPLSKGLDKGRKDVRGFVDHAEHQLGGRLARSFDKLQSYGAKIGAGLGVAAGFAAVGKNATDGIIELDRFSQGLGIGISTLDAWGHHAKKSGLEVAELSDMVKDATARLAEAKLGTGEAVEVLKILGLEADKLGSMKVADQFKLLADRLNGIANTSDKLMLVDKLFGGDAVKMTGFLQGLDKAEESLSKLRSPIDEKAVADAKAFQESWLDFTEKTKMADPWYAKLMKENIGGLGVLGENLGLLSGKRNASDAATPGWLGRATSATEFGRSWLASGLGQIIGVGTDFGGMQKDFELSQALSPLQASQRARGLNVDGIERKQDAQTQVLTQIREHLHPSKWSNLRPVVELKPAGAL